MVNSYKLICLVLFGLIAQLTVVCDAKIKDYRFKRRNATGRVIDGVEAGWDEFTDFVGLFIKKPGTTDNFYCGGVLIRRFLVLTAGHCLDGVANANDILVLNTAIAPIAWSDEEFNQAVRVDEFCKHPSYLKVDGKIWFDYAILRLQRSFDNFNVGVLSNNRVNKGDTVTAIGIGFSHYDSNNKKNNVWPRRLRKIDMELVDCEDYNRGNTHVCFTSKFGGDVCYGDSGSPVYNADSEIVAIVSYGNPGENCLHNYKAKTVFADVVFTRSEIDSLIDRCRLREPDPPEAPEEEDEIIWVLGLD